MANKMRWRGFQVTPVYGVVSYSKIYIGDFVLIRSDHIPSPEPINIDFLRTASFRPPLVRRYAKGAASRNWRFLGVAMQAGRRGQEIKIATTGGFVFPYWPDNGEPKIRDLVMPCQPDMVEVVPNKFDSIGFVYAVNQHTEEVCFALHGTPEVKGVE